MTFTFHGSEYDYLLILYSAQKNNQLYITIHVTVDKITNYWEEPRSSLYENRTWWWFSWRSPEKAFLDPRPIHVPHSKKHLKIYITISEMSKARLIIIHTSEAYLMVIEFQQSKSRTNTNRLFGQNV